MNNEAVMRLAVDIVPVEWDQLQIKEDEKAVKKKGGSSIELLVLEQKYLEQKRACAEINLRFQRFLLFLICHYLTEHVQISLTKNQIKFQQITYEMENIRKAAKSKCNF